MSYVTNNTLDDFLVGALPAAVKYVSVGALSRASKITDTDKRSAKFRAIASQALKYGLTGGGVPLRVVVALAYPGHFSAMGLLITKTDACSVLMPLGDEVEAFPPLPALMFVQAVEEVTGLRCWDYSPTGLPGVEAGNACSGYAAALVELFLRRYRAIPTSGQYRLSRPAITRVECDTLHTRAVFLVNHFRAVDRTMLRGRPPRRSRRLAVRRAEAQGDSGVSAESRGGSAESGIALE
jgi:hypothetical protein